MTSTGHDRRIGDGVEETSALALPAAASELAAVRRWARRFLEERGAPEDVIDDVELAASELATNVVRHTDSGMLRLRIVRSRNAWILDVADAGHVPAPTEARLPPSDDPTGRGLYVVTSVMDRVEVVTVDGAQVIRCTRAETS